MNPIIRGWANYYSTVVSKEIFSKLDLLIFLKLWSWAKKRHHNKGKKWIVRKYWHSYKGDNWVFSTNSDEAGVKLFKHSKTPIVRFTKVKQKASPFDGNLKYWSTRKGESHTLPTRVAKLLKSQKGKCKYCGMFFKEEDEVEIDHIIPRAKGGKDT